MTLKPRSLGVACVLVAIWIGLVHADPGQEAVAARTARLIVQLGDDEFAKREAAGDALAMIGELALPALQSAAASDPDPEIRWRAKQTMIGIAARLREVAGRRDLEKLQGTWYTVSTSYQGTRTPENHNDTIAFEGNRYIQTLDGKLLAAGQITISDATANPKEIEYDATEGLYAGQFWGIYTIDGSDLVLCSLQGNAASAIRPSAFSDQVGFMRVLKRVEKPQPK
jgi:uncharacterized protein (TIGR03067 family)